jgi:3-deoxy-D-manno-octulosonate 8-phosphate phosphatase (KDO 8-P phosphatase)
MNSLPRIIFTDIDGVWTDGGMYYDNHGNELKRFNTADSAGVLYAKALTIPVAIITGEDTLIVKRRADKLKIDYLYQGISNKVAVAEKLIGELGISWSECAYIGDDLGDVSLLKAVGFSACPQNAPAFIKAFVHYVTASRGGDGAFREFVEYILKQRGVLDKVIGTIIDKQQKPS